MNDTDLVLFFEPTQEARHAAVLRINEMAKAMVEPEQWRPVAGFEGVYSVSSLGRVRSEARVVERRGAHPQRIRERILKPGKHTGGYRIVMLCVEARPRVFLIQKLVLTAFRGARPPGMEARHLNGDPTDNRLSNLEWGTPVENAADRDRHNRQVRGQAVGNSKLTEADVRSIRADVRPQKEIAADFGVTQTMVSRIKLGKAWGWLA